MANYKEKLIHITTFIFDYDGVLTDGKVFVINNHEQLRSSNVKDGYALQYAVKKGYRVAVISGGKSKTMTKRMNTLGITDVFLGIDNKIETFKKYLLENNLKPNEVLYMGDDIPDLHALQIAGLACCPVDAAAEIRSVSQYISHLKGGEGCARDVIEKVMKLQGNWNEDVSVRAQ